MKNIINELNKINRRGYSFSNVFSDWLDLMLYSLLALTKHRLDGKTGMNIQNKYNDEYLKIINKYSNTEKKGEREADFFAKAYAEFLIALVNEKDKDKKLELEKTFKEDLKKRINETAKYIRPEEDTLEFAFMFIPAEGIYYDLLINEIGAVKVNTRSLIDYAFNEKKVIIVSPTTFAAYLQTVLQGLKALQIEESAKEIKSNVEKLSKHLLSFEEYMKKLGNNLGTTVNMYNSAYKELNKIDKDVVKITEGEKTVDPLILDKPKLDE